MTYLGVNLALGAVALSLAGAASASPTALVQPATAESPKAGAKEKVYCVRATNSGSRMPQKVCRTRKAWQAQGFDPEGARD